MFRILAGFVLYAWMGICFAQGIPEPANLALTGITLKGTLLHPDSPGPWPVALIIAGSGPTDRDGNSAAGRNDSLRLLAEGLARAGVASVRYDKRGVAASAGKIDEAQLRFSDYASDAAAWVGQLKRDRRFSFVLVIGHSEGSTLGILAAQHGADALVSIAGPGRDAAAVLRMQLAGKLPSGLAERNEEILAALQHGQSVAEVPAELNVLYRPSVQPYLISWFKVDPAREIAKLTQPVALVQGDTDIQVSVEDARLLAAAQPNAQLRVIAGMNHMLKIAPRGDLSSYFDPVQPVSQELLDFLATFIRRSAPTQSPRS